MVNEEKMMILKMLQEGKITAEEAAKLLESVDTPKPQKEEPLETGKDRGKFFRVNITDTNTGKSRANIRIPLSVLGAATKFGAHFVPDIEGLDSNELTQAIKKGIIGKIVDVYDDEDGEHVEVFIE